MEIERSYSSHQESASFSYVNSHHQFSFNYPYAIDQYGTNLEFIGQEEDREDEEDEEDKEDEEVDCISYLPIEKIIRISCDNIRLTDIDEEISDPLILAKNYNGEGGIWLLNANIVVDEESTLIIDSRDTKWLKISSTGDNANSLEVLGNLKIDSVKITSWNPEINNYTKFRFEKMPEENITRLSDTNKIPRPYVVVDNPTGSVNITNSELSYLGYDCGGGKCHGLTFYGGIGTTIKDNDIHHNSMGFYSNGLGRAVLEKNHVHHNYAYGIDPHTGTHDLTIRNNTVHDNGSIGIICSLDCYDIIIEHNKVNNNTKAGVMLSRLTYNSVIRNNTISEESVGISISESYNNRVYNNTVFDVINGIELKASSYDNVVQDNKIERPLKYGLRIYDNATANTLELNTVTDILDQRRLISIANGLTDINIVRKNNVTG